MSMPDPRTVRVTGSITFSPVGPSNTALAPRERRNPIARERLRQRVAAEFIEMPGLQLTLPQAWRLFSLRSDICLRLMKELADVGVLRRTADGQFALRDSRR
jgi:hypothetical protein